MILFLAARSFPRDLLVCADTLQQPPRRPHPRPRPRIPLSLRSASMARGNQAAGRALAVSLLGHFPFLQEFVSSHWSVSKKMEKMKMPKVCDQGLQKQ